MGDLLEGPAERRKSVAYVLGRLHRAMVWTTNFRGSVLAWGHGAQGRTRRLARAAARAKPVSVATVSPAVAQRGDGGIDTPPPPPACPTGWHVGPPDFIGLGAQRCGTTRWFDLIASHPEVARSVSAKELHYFDSFYAREFTVADTARYHEYFPRDSRHKTGEWTPLYLSAPWIPKLLAAAAPDARLLVLLRDPIERYLSGLQLDTSVAERRGVPLSRYAPLEAFLRGLYHSQLAALLKYFDRSQLLVLQYERCSSEPLPQLARTFEFLALSDTAYAPELGAHPKRQPEKPALTDDTRDAYVQAYSDDVAGLIDAFPEIDVRLWPNFAHLADRSPLRA